MPLVKFPFPSRSDPATTTGLARGLRTRAREEGNGILWVHAPAGDVLALGRYHVVPENPPSEVAVVRRLCGGRPMPLGDGFVGVVLAMPHPAALVATDATTLAPERVLNRAVRGLLGALEALGVAANYPGRDVVTCGGRPLAALAFDVDPDGATVV